MKKLLFTFVTILLPILASAQDAVEIDGIYYNLITKGNVAEVTSNPNYYSGDIDLPESITYNGVVYSVTSIGNRAFYRCSDLTSINIPNSVTSIGSFAFQDCSSLSSITIPYSVTSIGDWAFSSCSTLISITIPNNITSIGKWAFNNCSILTSIIIPNSVTSISQSAFQNCTSLTSITIPNNVTSIGANAFGFCNSLTSITIPNSVTMIGAEAFYKCSDLKSITIGSGIEYILSQAFASCPKLTDVYCYAENVPSANSDTFYGSYIEYVTLHVPSASVNTYKAVEPWKNFKSIVALGGSTPEAPKCATPTISYVNGKLVFSCETEDVKYQYDYKSMGSGSANNVELEQTYIISVYATKEGYENSDVATKEIQLSYGSGSGKVGDVNGDGVVNAADVVKVVDIISGN